MFDYEKEKKLLWRSSMHKKWGRLVADDCLAFKNGSGMRRRIFSLEIGEKVNPEQILPLKSLQSFIFGQWGLGVL